MHVETAQDQARPPALTQAFLANHLALLQENWLGFIERCAGEYGDIVDMRLLGPHMYLISHPEHIEEVLVHKNRKFTKDKTLRSYSSLYGEGLLTSEGDFWRRQRRLMQPEFHRDRISAYAAVMVAYTEQMLARWEHEEVRDIYQEMRRLTLTILAKTLFGIEISEREAAGNTMLGIDLDLGERAGPELDQVLYRLIEERRAQGAQGDDLLSLLLRARYEDGEAMDTRQVRDEIVTLLIAGYDTSTLALSWIWCLLSQHPSVSAALTAELRATLGGRAPAAADLPQLVYADMIVREALRLYPPVWGFGREVAEDCQIGGYTIPAGATVFVSQWIVQRDQRYWDAPESFNPDRWRSDRVKHLPRFAYFPFGGGPRLCIGQPFAMTEITLLLAMIAQKFRFKLLPDQNLTPQAGLTLQPKHGIQMQIVRRS